MSFIKFEKILGLDLDGVIIDHTAPKLAFAKSRGFQISPSQTHSDIIKNIIPPALKNEMMHYLYDDEATIGLAGLIPGALEGLKRTKQSGIKYFLISRRKNPAVAVKHLEFHGLWSQYFNSENVAFVLTPEDKNTKAAEWGITHYVDDQLHVLEKMHSVPNRFHFDNYNLFDGAPFCRKVTSWEELYENIR